MGLYSHQRSAEAEALKALIATIKENVEELQYEPQRELFEQTIQGTRKYLEKTGVGFCAGEERREAFHVVATEELAELKSLGFSDDSTAKLLQLVATIRKQGDHEFRWN